MNTPTRNTPSSRIALTLILVFAVVFSTGSPVAADILYLNEGEEHTGKLIRIDRNTVTFDEIGSGQLQLPAASVTNVLLSTLRKGDEIQNIASLTDPLAIGVLSDLPDPASYPNSDFITLFRQRRFIIKPDGSFDLERREMVQILKEPGLGKADQATYYMADREKVELLWGHTYAPDGRVFHITDDTVSDEGIFSSTPEYDKLRKLKFGLKKVDLGSVIDVAWKLTATAPTSLRPMLIDDMYGEREPTVHDELTVQFPENVPLRKTLMNWTGDNLPAFTELSDPVAKTRTWTWTFKDMKGFTPEADMPPMSRIFPRIMMYVEADWSDLAVDFSRALRAAAPTPALLDAFIAETGAASAPNDLAKAAAVYDKLLRRVRFLGIGCPAAGGVEPVKIDVALQKRYGNSLARVTLLHAALARLGIESHVGFMQAWNVDGIKREIPSFGQAVSAILKLEIDGRTFYAACDNDYLPLGIVDTDAQGTTACFLNASGTGFVFDHLPEGGSDNRNDRYIYVQLDANGSMDVRDVRTIHGPAQASLRSLKAAKEKEKQNFAEQMVKRVHPKAKLSGFAMSNLDDLNAPVSLTLQYRIPDGAVKASEHLMAFRNHWISYNARSAGLATRTYPLDYFSTEETVNTVVFELPEGFGWVPWNRDYNWNCGCLSYESTLTQHLQTLQFTDRFRVTRKTYPPAAEYRHYRGCLQIMSELAKQWLIIERKPLAQPGGLKGPLAPDPQG